MSAGFRTSKGLMTVRGGARLIRESILAVAGTGTELSSLLDSVLHAALACTGTNQAKVFLYDNLSGDVVEVKGTHRPGENGRKRDKNTQAIVAQVVRDGATCATKSCLAVPLRVNGRLIGVLNIESTPEIQLTRRHATKLERLASRISPILQRAVQDTAVSVPLYLKLYNEAETTANELKLINELTESIAVLASELDLEMVLQVLYAEAQRITNAAVVGILLADDRNQELIINVGRGELKEGVQPRIKFGDGVTGHVANQRKPLLVPDVMRSHLYLAITAEFMRSELAVPIMLGGRLLGVINVEAENPNHFTPMHEQMLGKLARIGAVFIDRAQRYEATEAQRREQAAAAEQQLALDMSSLLGLLAGQIVHSMNNAISVIRVYVQELELKRDRLAFNELQVLVWDRLTRIKDSAETALALVQKIRRPFALCEIRSATLRPHVEKAVAKASLPNRIEVFVDVAEGIEVFTEDRLSDVLEIMFRNAAEAMPGGGELRVRAYPTRDKTVAIQVSDTGVGISSESLKKVFEFGYSTKGKRDENLGIGLWWVKLYLRRLGGNIDVYSVPGGGTDFLITLPAP